MTHIETEETFYKVHKVVLFHEGAGGGRQLTQQNTLSHPLAPKFSLGLVVFYFKDSEKIFLNTFYTCKQGKTIPVSGQTQKRLCPFKGRRCQLRG